MQPPRRAPPFRPPAGLNHNPTRLAGSNSDGRFCENGPTQRPIVETHGVMAVLGNLQLCRRTYGARRFPLTPALSREEREKRSPRGEESSPLDGSQWVRLLFPLPPGEGQGEGRAQQAGLMRRSGLEVGSAVGPKGRMALRHIIYPKSAALPEYVFSVFDAWLPLPARDERGEGRGGGRSSVT